jgi:hypothetical protein
VSAKQLQRTLGLGYRAAWFMAHRIRMAMSPARPVFLRLGLAAMDVLGLAADERLVATPFTRS